MGNNGSTSTGGHDSSSPKALSSSNGGGGGRTSSSRTHSLTLGHHYQSHHPHHRHRQQHHHSDRRYGGGAQSSLPIGATSSTPSRRSSSRFRQALPNLVNNVSAAIGHKLPWTSSSSSTGGLASAASKRRFQKPTSLSTNAAAAEKRSRSKTREHCRLFRDLVNDWRLSDLHCLVVEFEAAAALRELRRRADSTRPQAATLKEDFARLFHGIHGENGDDSSADAFLVSNERTYPVHRAFLSRRCSFFRLLFRGWTNADWRPTIPVNFPSQVRPLDSDAFGLLLEYLYTGELGGDSSSSESRDEQVNALIRFNDEHRLLAKENGGRCGDAERKWTTLEEDVGAMLTDIPTSSNESAPDAVLIFTNANATPLNSSRNALDDETTFEQATEEATITPEEETKSKRSVLVEEKQKSKTCRFKCHSIVLAARSPFFRAIIRKRRVQDEQRQQKEDDANGQGESRSSCSSPWRRQTSSITGSSSGGLLEIVLDESVIPRQYAPVLLHAMYTDEVDLSLVMRDCVATAASSLTEVQAIASGKCQLSPVDEATEIYQIARFLEFDKLAQGCEDVIVSYISSETLSSIYAWSSESYGSIYVRRHCINYLCQEFGRFCTSPLLFETDETLLVEALKSDFVQASELEILNAVIRWGEHQLIRRIEEREPNILAGTTHSISRKGVKRADLSDTELKEILANLLPLIRIDYVLPPNHTVLESAIARGLINFPSMDLLSGSAQMGRGVLLPPVVAARRHQQHGKRNSGSHHHHRHSPSALVRSCSSSGSPTLDDDDEAHLSMMAAAKAQHLEFKAQDHWSKPHRRSAGPRLFLPYLDESRTLLEKRVAESPDKLSSLINHHPPVETVTDRLFAMHRSSSMSASTTTTAFPDALYMVDGTLGHNCSYEDGDASEITVPSSITLLALQDRVNRILRTSSTVKRALACGCSYHRNDVLRQVRLRAIREMGLLDSTLAILDTYGRQMHGLTSPSSPGYAGGRHTTSFCSSAPLSPMSADLESMQYVDTDSSFLDEAASHHHRHHQYDQPSPNKRRFRSQPELSQVDLTGYAASGSNMDWPDLMASSLGATTSMDGLSPTHPNYRVTTTSSGALDWPSSSKNVPCTSSNINSTGGDGEREELRQQLVDLTQQICDLVTNDEGGNQSSTSSPSNSSAMSPGRNTTV